MHDEKKRVTVEETHDEKKHVTVEETQRLCGFRPQRSWKQASYWRSGEGGKGLFL
jgi:hypothetical protein